MRRCNEPHPERPQTVCIQPESGRHIDHVDARGTTWPNVQVQEEIARAPKRRKGRRAGDASDDAKKKIKAIAAGAEPERHVNPLADGRRPFNGPGREASRDLVEHSLACADDRTAFFLLMAEVATTKEILSTNDVWDVVEARHPDRFKANRNYVGVVGRMGAGLGLWARTGATESNTSGNSHAVSKEENLVKVYRSLIVGKPFEPIAKEVMAKSGGSLDSKQV